MRLSFEWLIDNQYHYSNPHKNNIEISVHGLDKMSHVKSLNILSVLIHWTELGFIDSMFCSIAVFSISNSFLLLLSWYFTSRPILAMTNLAIP